MLQIHELDTAILSQDWKSEISRLNYIVSCIDAVCDMERHHESKWFFLLCSIPCIICRYLNIFPHRIGYLQPTSYVKLTIYVMCLCWCIKLITLLGGNAILSELFCFLMSRGEEVFLPCNLYVAQVYITGQIIKNHQFSCHSNGVSQGTFFFLTEGWLKDALILQQTPELKNESHFRMHDWLFQVESHSGNGV